MHNNMIRKTLLPLFASLFFFSCSNDAEQRAQEKQQLVTMLEEIKALVAIQPCEDASQWSYVAYGYKACGGPEGYLAYPNTIDTADFLERVAIYTAEKQAFDERWNNPSDCAFALEPGGVVCENGKPVLLEPNLPKKQK